MREREGEGGSEREREREGGSERERETERERVRERRILFTVYPRFLYFRGIGDSLCRA